MTIGIPKGLFYYRYFPLWKVFFHELGVDILVSQNTDRRILDNGVESCVDEACLPIKIYHGHVHNIKDMVDYLFIPRFTSVSKNEYICPKFGGLPDMIRSAFDELPEIIDVEVNLRRTHNTLKPFMETGLILEKQKKEIKEAYSKALIQYRYFRECVKTGYFPSDVIEGKKLSEKRTGTLKILLLGHIYNTCDKYLNLNIVNKLKLLGANVFTMEMFNQKLIRKEAECLNKAMFWDFGTTAVGCTHYVLKNLVKTINGVIYISSFGCGIDSFVSYMSEKRIRTFSNIPFMTLTVDEHSGEAGLDTRLEAFIDTIKWRKNNENYFPTSG